MGDLTDYWVVAGTAAPVLGLAHALLIGVHRRATEEAQRAYNDLEVRPFNRGDAEQALRLWDRKAVLEFARFIDLPAAGIGFAACVVTMVAALRALELDASGPDFFCLCALTVAFLALAWPPFRDGIAASATARSREHKSNKVRVRLEKDIGRAIKYDDVKDELIASASTRRLRDLEWQTWRWRIEGDNSEQIDARDLKLYEACREEFAARFES